MMAAETLQRPSHARRAATARRLGEEQMQLALDAATSTDPSFSARAYTFIVAYVREQSARLGSVPGGQIARRVSSRSAATTEAPTASIGSIA